MKKMVLVTVGFDEKLVLRPLLKIGLDRGDTVLLVYSKSGSRHDVERVERAVDTIKSVIGSLGIDVVEAVVSASDFLEDVTIILQTIARYDHGGEIVVALTGGMRLVIIESIVALLLYRRLIARNTKARFLLMREDGLYDVVLPFEVFELAYTTDRELEVLTVLAESGLENVKRSEAVKTTASRLGVSEYAVYKHLSALERKGYVSIEESKIRITELGRLIARAVTATREVRK